MITHSLHPVFFGYDFGMSQKPAASLHPSIFERDDRYLVESREDILQLLNGMLLSSTPCAAYIEGREDFLVCSILGLEPEQNAMYLRYDAENAEVDSLPKGKGVCYIALHADAKIQFLSSQPQSCSYRSHNALRVPIPKLLWSMQRREYPRHIMGRGQISIILNFAGIGSVEAEAADISIAGVGIIHYHPQLRLEPGLVLEDCEIRIPGEAVIKVRMRIQHSTPIQFPDGEIVKRSGCQFIDLSQTASKVLANYLNSL